MIFTAFGSRCRRRALRAIAQARQPNLLLPAQNPLAVSTAEPSVLT